MKDTTSNLPVELSEDFNDLLNYLVDAGYVSDITITDKRIRDMQQSVRKNAYHNTELLLNNYRKYAWTLKYFPQTVAEDYDLEFKDSDTLIEALDIGIAQGNNKLENRLRNYVPTRNRVDRLLEAVSLVKEKPENGKVLHSIIDMRYINPTEYTVDEICKNLNISLSSYHRLRKEAIELISYRLWGTDNKKSSIAIQVLDFLYNENKNKPKDNQV